MSNKNLRIVDDLEHQILKFIQENKGTDAEEIAKHFAIPLLEAVEITEQLLKVGLLKIIE